MYTIVRIYTAHLTVVHGRYHCRNCICRSRWLVNRRSRPQIRRIDIVHRKRMPNEPEKQIQIMSEWIFNSHCVDWLIAFDLQCVDRLEYLIRIASIDRLLSNYSASIVLKISHWHSANIPRHESISHFYWISNSRRTGFLENRGAPIVFNFLTGTTQHRHTWNRLAPDG